MKYIFQSSNNFIIKYENSEGFDMVFSLKKKLLGTSIILTLVGTITPGLSVVASASTVEGTEQVTEVYDIETFISEVEPYVQLSENNHLELSDNIPSSVYEKYSLEDLEKRFSELNSLEEKNEIIITENLEIFENDKQPKISILSLASNGYKVEKYWWGSRTYFTDKGTKNAVKELQDSVLYGTTAGTLISLKFPPLAPLGAAVGLYAQYYNLLQRRMSEHNNGNGVIVDMTRVDVFSVSPRPISGGGM